MKGLLALIIGGLSFALIAGSQMNAYTQSSVSLIVKGDLSATIISVHWSIKLITISIALIALALSINYTRSGQKKMNVVNRVGRYLAILAIILSIIPVYQIFLK